MTFLITTGSDTEALRAVGDRLLEAGMAAARPSLRDEQWTLERWHREVLARQHGTALSVQQPGRLWEQLAVDILLANMQAECWGWSGPDAVPLLDFWASFEAQTRFILLCEPFERMLSRFLVSDAPLDALNSTVEQWQRTHEALLRFHLRHPSTSTLLWGADVVASPVSFVAHVATTLEVPALKADERAVSDTRPQPAITNPLRAFIAEQLTSAFPEASALAHELAASIRPLSEAEATLEAPERVVGGVRNGPELALELLRGYREDSQRYEALIVKAREAQQHSLAAEEREAKERTDRAAGELKAVTDENELLLAQLHQVQEELERLFLEHAQAKSELEKQSESMSTLAQQRDADAHARAVALAEGDAVRQELDAQKAARADAEEQARTARTTVDETTARLNDTAQENELLLSQLHQVQEELERYFLEYSASRATAQALETRLARLLGSLPGGFDCGALALVESPEEGGWQWLAEDIRVAGRSVESLRYATRVEQGSVVLTLPRDGATPGALLRWPLNARNESSVTLAALPDPQGGSTYLTHLAQLTTSDWEMMHGLLRQMVRQMARGTIAVPPDQGNGYAQAIGASLSLIGQLAPVVRFDDSTLTGQTVNARREVLGLRLSNVSFGRLRVPELELQFQSEIKADATSGDTSLGGVTCLIFGREAAAGPFEAWVSNASDASGKPVMGILATAAGPVEGPWDRLTPADQAFVVALCDALPLCLATLNVRDVRIKRPLKAWATLASELGKWLRKPAVAASGSEPEAPAPATASPEAAEELAAVPSPRTQLGTRKSAPRKQRVVDGEPASTPAIATVPTSPSAKSSRTEKRPEQPPEKRDEKRKASKPLPTPAKRTTPPKATPKPAKPKVAAPSRAPSKGGSAHARTNAPVDRAARPAPAQRSARSGTKR